MLDVLLELQWVGRLEQPEAQLEATYVLLVDLRTEAIEPLFEKLCLRRSDITDVLWQQTQLAQLKLADVVKALNSLGATPQDLVAILQAMKSAGALNAELEVI